MFIKGRIKYKALSLEACGKVLEYYVCDCNILFPHKRSYFKTLLTIDFQVIDTLIMHTILS